jgi:UDP-N-acetylmuramate dehydrogenase
MARLCYFSAVSYNDMNTSGAALKIRENVPLAPYTTLGVGGPARFLIEAKHEQQVIEAVDFAHARSCPLFILGGGSNVLVSDSGFPGVVLKINLKGIDLPGGKEGETLSAAAGEEWDRLVKRCVSGNLAGIACLSGIPGTVGAAPVQNIGAYGEEIGEVIVSLTVFDREKHQFLELSNAECRFGYRCSIFNTTHEDRYIILRVLISLRPHGPVQIRYHELRDWFAGSSRKPTLSQIRHAVLKLRQSKAMVLRQGDMDSRSAGSFFKNPVLDAERIAQIEATAKRHGLMSPSGHAPSFPAEQGKTKLPAAWLIERAGFHKGYSYGNAGLSSKHTLAIVNRGNATAREIFDLMNLIRHRVRDIFGVDLQPEPKLVGSW